MITFGQLTRKTIKEQVNTGARPYNCASRKLITASLWEPRKDNTKVYIKYKLPLLLYVCPFQQFKILNSLFVLIVH